MAPGDQRIVDVTSYQYDTSHNLSKITYFDGTEVNWEYDPDFSQVTAITDELGRQTLFEIDPSTGNVEEKRIVVGADDRTTTELDDVVTQYDYTADGLFSQVVQLRNDIDGAPQTSFVTQYTYTDTNSVTGTTHNTRRLDSTVYGGDNPSVSGITLINSSTVSVGQRDDYDNPTEWVDEMGRSTLYQYDDLDRLILERTDDPGFSQLVAAIENDFSLGGRLHAQAFGTLLTGGSGAFTATPSGPMTDEYYYTECDCPDRFSLDCYNFQEAEHTDYSNNPDGSLSAMSGPDGSESNYGYGPSQSPVRTQRSASSQGGGGSFVGSTQGSSDALYLYNARGELVAELDGAGVLTRYEYDARGRQVRSLTGEGSSTECLFNGAGDKIACIDGEGRSTHYSYDDAGRVSKQWEPGSANPSSYLYDTLGNVRTVIDPLANYQHYIYDERSRVIETIDENGDSTFFTYYDDNQLESLTDANDNTTTWTYDDAGRVHTETNELNHTETYYYDEFNRLAEVEDRNGRIVQYTYDGRTLVSEEWFENSTPVRRISYEYRPSPNGGTSGQIETITDTAENYISSFDDTVYHYQYDGHGRLEFSEMTIGGLNVSIETLRAYDLGDRLIGTQFSIDASPDSSPNGAVDHENAYVYDAAGRVASITQSGPAGVTNPKRVELAYNRAAQFAAIDRYAAATPTNSVASTQYSYDEHGRLILIDHDGTASGSTFAEAHGYAYDGANRMASYTNVLDSVFAQYGYDNRAQLTGADHVGTIDDETYDYDANGNRETANGQTYQTASNNRILSDGEYSYEYDNEGNVIERWKTNDPGERTYYTWDHRNRLVRVSEWIGDHEALIVDYAYDAYNQLVFQRTNKPFEDGERSTVFVYDNGQVELQFDKAGSGSVTAGDLSHRYLWGPTVDQLLADEQVDWSDEDADGEVLWAITDHLSSVRDVIDSNGDLRIHRQFDAFGNIVDENHYNASGGAVTAGQAGFVDIAFGFTGRYLDIETSLQNNLNRWYDPTIGRWINEDPIGFDADDANLYRYVSNTPTAFVDPQGTLPTPIEPSPPDFDADPDLESKFGPPPPFIVPPPEEEDELPGEKRDPTKLPGYNPGQPGPRPIPNRPFRPKPPIYPWQYDYPCRPHEDPIV